MAFFHNKSDKMRKGDIFLTYIFLCGKMSNLIVFDYTANIAYFRLYAFVLGLVEINFEGHHVHAVTLETLIW